MFKSASFDAIEHAIFIYLPQTLDWYQGHKLFYSYLSDRTYLVIIGNYKSTTNIASGVLQGSILFSTYMFPLSQIIQCYNVKLLR